MNRDDIIRWAREAHHELVTKDCPGHAGQLDPWTMQLLERFANLVAAAEREACLAILRDMEGKKWHLAMHCEEIKGVSLHDAYAAIRARGGSESL